jgi:hypothetical protein
MIYIRHAVSKIGSIIGQKKTQDGDISGNFFLDKWNRIPAIVQNIIANVSFDGIVVPIIFASDWSRTSKHDILTIVALRLAY